MNPPLTCQQKFHEFEPIIGFCLNTECSEQPKYCTQCIFKCHLTHKEDCKSLYSIKSFLKMSAESIDRLLTKVLCDWKYIQEVFQNIINVLQIEQVQIQDLDRAFENEEYQSLSDKIESLKTYHYLTQKIDQLCSVNFYCILKLKLEDDLDELHNFCQSLNSLSKPELKINTQEPLEFQRKSQNIEALINESCVLIEKGRFQEALEFSNQVLGLDPNNKIALNNKGLILTQLQFYQEAMTCLDDAIQLYPNDQYILMNQENTLNKLNRKKEAKQLIQQAIQEDSSSQLFASHLGDLKSLILDLNRQPLTDYMGGVQEIQQQTQIKNYPSKRNIKPPDQAQIKKYTSIPEIKPPNQEFDFNLFSKNEIIGNLEPEEPYDPIVRYLDFINAQPEQYHQNVVDDYEEIRQSSNQYNVFP